MNKNVPLQQIKKKYRALRLQCVQALHIMVNAVGDAEALSFFVPGITMGKGKRKRNVIMSNSHILPLAHLSIYLPVYSFTSMYLCRFM